MVKVVLKLLVIWNLSVNQLLFEILGFVNKMKKVQYEEPISKCGSYAA